MKVSVSPKLVVSDVLFVFVPEKKWNKSFFGKLISSGLEKQISTRLKDKDFEGKLGEFLQLFPGSRYAKKTFLIGTGNGKEIIDMRKSASLALRKVSKLKSKKVSFLLPKKFDVARAISGALLGNYEFKVGDTKEHFSPKSLHIVSSEKIPKSEISSEIALAEAANLTRDLVNLPPNMLTPQILARKSKQIGKGVGNKVKVKVHGEKELKKLGMGSFFGVGQGSHEESQLIIFEYFGGKKKDAPIAFLGKGVCFDSGGYNLKPTKHIESMKSDMAGAAAVIGLFSWIAKAKPQCNVIGVVGAVENLVSGNAYKPGDILHAMNGKTIEITNTDAEGRLVLADCLHYTEKKYKPAFMMDAATLTGAVIAALGYQMTAIVTNDQKKVEIVKKAALEADEPVWQLPLTDHFREKTKGTISDLLNWTAGVSAGSCMAAAFLENFIEKTSWVHFDIAGTAFHESSGDELSPKGATGVMVRTFSEIVKTFS